ncbi:hypothetical protein J2S19_000696 [Metabacillus malikii]|uniref:Uncharacterized protein n=1 Tax=Metabacillus malikii TaxID=1504265 RepID=A0ABT9ZDX7_9BACI|nr:hypothetical protein [Metabacillus malikii]
MWTIFNIEGIEHVGDWTIDSQVDEWLRFYTTYLL